jgi:hypothetical protein
MRLGDRVAFLPIGILIVIVGARERVEIPVRTVPIAEFCPMVHPKNVVVFDDSIDNEISRSICDHLHFFVGCNDRGVSSRVTSPDYLLSSLIGRNHSHPDFAAHRIIRGIVYVTQGWPLRSWEHIDKYRDVEILSWSFSSVLEGKGIIDRFPVMMLIVRVVPPATSGFFVYSTKHADRL